MKRQKLKWIIAFLVSSVLSGLGAQTAMNVKVKSSIQSSYDLSDINKLTFASGNLTVNKKDGSQTDFALTNALNLNFSNITSIAEIKSNEQSNMLLYPNPVVNKFQICYKSLTEENVSLQIIDFQGKVIYLQNQQSQAGINYLYIPFEKYQDGMYLCRLQHGGNIEIKKFIKQ
jgi:hypothetical protein